ncbi:YadA-like family protein [Megasphaera massiliensis]|jgi:autotransporter adhesin|uniref:YadA-like family protein n=1 Tax=Megasphaera massiliensis TaxID=1232428 RepID=UPI0009DB91AD|nr:YadA-like family protein [uncultured Megasphaera sp.]
MNFGRDEIFSPAWRSSLGAVSVGVQSAGSAATVTRQIVGVAAGTQDTDAVNVAQLKKLDTKVEKHRVHYFAVSTTDTDNDGNTNALGTDSMAIGPSARANLNRSLAIGKSAGAYVDGGIALGSDSYNIVTSGMRGYIPTSVSLTEEEQTTPTWRATLGALAIGVSAVDSTGAVTTATQTRQIVGVAAGTQDTDAVNVAQLKALGSTVDANKISFVSINEKSRGDNDNKDNDGATGDDAIAIGVFASATAPNATAMGQKAKATNYNSIALGDFANASGIGSTAVGDYAIASSHSTVAVGSDANATGLESIAIGHTAKGTGYQATAVGSEAAASGIDSLAAGFGSSAKGQFGSAFGSAATTDGDFATAAGYGAKATANSSTALGENATANIAGGVALGSYSKTNVNSGVLGYDPSDKITTQEILLGDNKDTYDNLQTEITTAQTNVSSLAQQILDLQTEYDTADDARRAEIVNEIKSLNKQFLAARADLQDKVSAANKLVSTWQATGAAVSVGDSETGLTRQITNVAAGTEDTDAVNVAQLSALNDKVDEGWTLAVARGSDSKTENDATVEGDSKQINVGDTVTLQAGRGIKLKQDEAAVQIGLKYLDVEPKGDTYNDAAASGEGALAIGQNSVASGQQGTAVGYAAQATGKSSFAGGTNAIAGGGNSIAIGTNAITSVQESIAIGKGKGNDTDGYKKVDSGFSVAIGSSAVVGENSASSVALGGSSQVTNSSSATALGGKAKVTDSVNGTAIGASAAVSGSRNGTAIGKNAKVENAEDAVALGSQSVANRAKGTVGYDVTGTDHSNDATGTWKSVLGAVSVGKTDNTRQITNVAAGSEDSDAVNVAQLKAAGTAGLNFKGDGDTVVHRDLGATLNVVGGNTDATALTEGNIGVVADSDAGTLSVKLAKNLALGDGSITFAPTGAKDADGNTLVQGQDGKWYSDLTDATYDATNNVYTKADGTTVSAVENPVVSSVKLTNTGLDNGGNKITNVAAGTVDTDIVNLGQLKGSQIKASDVTYADNGSGTITLTMQDDSKVTIDSLKDIYVKEGKLENNTLTFTRNDNTSFEVGDIASKTDMDSAVSNANLKFTGDNTAEAATLTKKNGETLNILGGATEFTTANNIGVVADTDKGTLNVKLAKNVSMGDGSITFAPNAKDAEGNALVQGQDGKWYSDLTDATYDATNNVYTKADGTTVSAVENPVVSAVTLTNTGLDNGGNKITNVAAGTEDTDIVNLKQLKGSTIKSSELKYTDAGVGTMTLTMQDGSKFEIGGLQDKYIKDASLDGNKLTITRNDDKKFEVDNIATTADIIGENSKVNLKFTGDDTSESATITKKNAETLTIYGGVAATDADGNSLLSDVNNVGVVKTDDGLQIKLAKDLSGIDSARIGGTVADGAATGGIYIANQSVTYNGSAKKTESGLYITGLANTKWNPTTDGIVSGRAATEDQLKAAYDGLSTTITANKIVAGDNITVTPLEDGSGTKVSLSDNLAFGDKNGKNIAINGKDGIISAGDGKDNQVVVDGANSTVTAGTGANQVTVDGTKAGITAGKGANQVAIDGTKGQVTIGEAGKGLVMGNQDVAVKNADGTDKADENGNAVKDSGKYITGLDNTTWKPEENGYVPNRAATEGQLKDVVGQVDTKIDGINKDIETINNAKRGFNSDTGEKIERGKDDVLDIKGGAKGELSEGNIGVVNNTGATGFDVKLAKDLKGLNSVTSNTVTTKELTVSEKANIGNVSISNDNVTIGTGDSKTVITNESVTTGSVTTGNTTINNDGLTVKNEDSLKNITVQNNNVSMGGNVVHNVADGVEATDAINKGQFDRTVNAIGTGMNQMSNRISKLDTRVDRVGAGAAALAALHPLEYNADEKWEISAGVGNYRGANAVAVGAFYRPNGNTLVSLGTSYGGGENMVNAGVTWRVGEGETGNYSSKQAMAQEISSLKSVVSDQSSQLQAQNSKIEAQSQQLEEQNKKIEQLMQAIAELKK